MTNSLFLFENTRGVIRAEACCRGRALPVHVVTVPRHLSSECGMCLSVDDARADDVARLLAAERIAFRRHAERSSRVSFDLLSTVESGGCSAKLPADLLARALRELAPETHPDLLVGVDTCDDAAVYRLSDDRALIVTTDFFPPVCSDPYRFGQIAAANALSDVFAMGGEPLLAMNLVMFPAEGIPFEVLGEILAGGRDKVREAGCLTVGGHTIADSPPKYGLAVTGLVHPDQVMTNAHGRPGEVLLLTKPLGTGALVAGHRLGEAAANDYRAALDTMSQLNREAAAVARSHQVRCATDVTGFGLLGHAWHIARASRVTVELDAAALPALPGALDLLRAGCIPGGAFRNLAYVQAACRFDAALSYERKMLCLDPQTSGGLLFSLSPDRAEGCLRELRRAGCPQAAIVGRLVPPAETALAVRPGEGEPISLQPITPTDT